MLQTALTIFLTISYVSAELPLCIDSVSESTKAANLCAKFNNYSRVEYPEPLPCHMSIELSINDIIDIDEELQIIRLYLILTVMWKDTRISLEFNPNHKPANFPHYLVVNKEFDSIWKPRIMFLNSISTELENEDIKEIWYSHPNILQSSQVYIVSLSCKMKFSSYPFDSHNCTMKLLNEIGKANYVLLKQPDVFYEGSSENYIYEGNPERLKFHTNIKSLPSTFKIIQRSKAEFNLNYSQANIEILLERKRWSSLITEYYFPTFTYSVLALISYFISIDSVPGRMGLLVTLYLIAINNYVSTTAPSTRGISYFDIWFIGCLFPLVFSILEYGMLLAITKYYKGQIYGKYLDTLVIDKIAFVFSLVYIILFNIFYWIACLNQ